ncbi:MAG: hypothetical protein JRG73_20200 [Deltaproteobacteria bacterium]|nr:hypothetical protein [Deltaproteobacteria bacterium]MBW2309251.1 hypothetical protein [Deltaproteobacteria bacterium]
MRIQFTVTSAEAKWMIAKGIVQLKAVKRAVDQGRIVLKGGTTVSAVAEEICGEDVRISGRITPRGTMTARYKEETGKHHTIIIEKRRVKGMDHQWEKVVARLEKNDLIIVGANAFDVYGNAALMAASFMGSVGGRCLFAASLEGIHTIVAVGLEKLVPGNLADIIPMVGRKMVDRSYGSAVGLIPVRGRIFTEKDAVEALAPVQCIVIGKGGVFGAEGSTTLLVDGEEKAVREVENVFKQIKGSTISGFKTSLEECGGGCPSCRNHEGCIYKKGFQWGREL